ncbi:hypothetical protein ACFY4I_18310 [Streptomyces scabiei]|uniref:hypothetical protein n=1 Tax=Streptomyces scabiei TaxID=1930 RepID=UPI003678721B
MDEVSRLTSKLMRNFEASFGYPPGDNGVLKATPEQGPEMAAELAAAGIGEDLLEFYSRVEGVSLPDVGNGFFIHSADAVVDGIREDQPTEVVGAIQDEITVFGSDGGGGLFALSSSGERVYRLDGGSLIGSTYDVDNSGVRVVANGFWDFLEYLRGELIQAVPADWI